MRKLICTPGWTQVVASETLHVTRLREPWVQQVLTRADPSCLASERLSLRFTVWRERQGVQWVRKRVCKEERSQGEGEGLKGKLLQARRVSLNNEERAQTRARTSLDQE